MTVNPKKLFKMQMAWKQFHDTHPKVLPFIKAVEAAGIREWIEEIEDSVARQVFKLYYIDGCGWAEVAKRMGYRRNPDYPRLHIRDAHLKKCGMK